MRIEATASHSSCRVTRRLSVDLRRADEGRKMVMMRLVVEGCVVRVRVRVTVRRTHDGWEMMQLRMLLVA